VGCAQQFIAALFPLGIIRRRPDATIAKELPINQPGILVHDYPDTMSPTGWYHNLQPMDMAEDTIMHWGTPSNSPRQRDGQSEP